MQMITTRTIGAAFVVLFIAAGGPAYAQDEGIPSDPMEDHALDEDTRSDPTEDQGAVGCGSVDGTGRQSVDGTGRQYTVKRGDTLRSIAAECYDGDTSKYRQILQANSFIVDENEIEPGQELTIPD